MLLSLVALLLCARPVVAQLWTDEDRQTMRQRREAHSPRIENALQQAQGIQKSNPDLALDILQSIFDAPEDSFFQTQNGCSLKDAAEVVILADVDGLLKAYERRFDATASGLLEQARRDGGLSGLREVARRFPLTTSGRSAMLELATAACDSGNAGSALRLVHRLRRNPSAASQFDPRLGLIELWALRELRDEPGAQQALLALRQRFPAGLELDGRRVPWFQNEADRDAWLQRLLPAPGSLEAVDGLPAWRLAHGNLRRNGAASTAPPFLDTAWKAPLADRYDDIRKYDDPWNDADIKLVNGAAADVETRFRNEGVHPLPVAAPLVTNDLAIFAGYGTIKAYRLATGELAWSSEPVDQTLSALLAGTDSFVQAPRTKLMQQFVGQRAYRDHVDASLSSDGRRVYHVGHSGLVGLQPFPGNLPTSNRGSSPLLPRNYNQLQAYELNGGRCLWSIGGPPRRLDAVFNRPEDELSLDGAFFCLAPIPWEDQLLCVIEQSRQLRIVALDPEKNPEKEPPLWSQALLNSDLDLVYSANRRFAGVNVALDGSTLVASLGNGTAVGFDVADRRWLWLQTYADPQPVDYRRQLQINRMNRSVTEEANLDLTIDVKEWSDSRTLISGRHVLLTPFDDSHVYCLDRISGQIQWKRPRDQAMTMAGVYDDLVLLIGKSDVRALSVADGRQRWSTPIPPASGRGVRMGSRYVLPLSTAEVLTIDIRTGAPLARSPLASGQPAGNLAAADGLLVTQSASEFRAFRSLADVTQQMTEALAGDPRHPEALALRGELRLHQGDVAGGEADLRSIAAPSPRLRQVLAWAVVNGLERDFPAYYTPDLNLDDLPADPALRVQAWTAISRGLEAQGDLPGSLLAALRAGENVNPQSDRLLDREDSLRVRENRALRGRIEALWRVMTPQQQSIALDGVRQRLAALTPAAPEQFRVHELLQGGILPADLELEQLARRNMPVAVVEQRLLRLRESPDPVIAARASLQLLGIAVQDPRMTPARAVVADLQGRLKDVVVNDGQTAGALAEALLNQPEFASRMMAAPVLKGEVVATGSDDVSGVQEMPATFTEFGSRSPILEGWTFAADGSQAHLYATDARGVLKFQERVNRGISGMTGRISTSGRLVLAETADGFRIFDAVSGTSISSATLLTEPFESFMGGNFGRVRTPNNFRPSSTRQVAPLRADHLAYFKGPQLIVADPLTGREHWSRTMEGATDIAADADFIAVFDGRGVARVFSAVDGQLVREGALPPGTQLPDYRHDVQRLIRLDEPQGATIGLYHVGRGEWSWQKTFPADSRFQVVNGREIAVLQPDGAFAVLSPDDGQSVVTAQLDPPGPLEGLEVFQDGGRLFVKAIRPVGADFLMTIPRGSYRPVKARITAVRRNSGQVLWSRDFDRLLLDPAQPGEWPFFVAIAAGEPDEAAEDPMAQVASWAYLLDRETGKTLHAAELTIASSTQRGWKTDAATGAVTLRISGVGLSVTPRSVPEPAAAPKDSAPQKEPGPAGQPVPPPPPESKPDP